MQYTMMMVIYVICIVSVVVGLIAQILDLMHKSNDQHNPYGPYEKYIKRPLDAFLSTGALIVLSPIMLITALLVRIKLGSPVIFKQERAGKNGKIFKLYKFRSMTNKKDEKGQLLPSYMRVTKFGRILRATSLDELPELINMIKGDMAVVGPRPLLASYLPQYNTFEQRRHEVRPGLTGLAQISGRKQMTWCHKFEKDVEYVDKVSFLMDAKIVYKTLVQTLRREGTEDLEHYQYIKDYFADHGTNRAGEGN